MIACTWKSGGELVHIGAFREEAHRDEPARGGEGRGRELAQAASMGKPLESLLGASEKEWSDILHRPSRIGTEVRGLTLATWSH